MYIIIINNKLVIINSHKIKQHILRKDGKMSLDNN